MTALKIYRGCLEGMEWKLSWSKPEEESFPARATSSAGGALLTVFLGSDEDLPAPKNAKPNKVSIS